MRRIRHSPEPIIRKLGETDTELANGTAGPETCKTLCTAKNTDSR